MRRRRRSARQYHELLRGAPQAPPPGMVAGPPDVVGVGAQKAGTSWWWSLLADHPDLYRRPIQSKELHYFDRFCTDAWSDDDGERYRSLFARPPGAKAGEFTPRYLSDLWAIPLLRRAAPDAALLVILRDPVERFRSAIDQARAKGLETGATRYEQAELRGQYVRQLRWLLAHFPAEQVLILQYERCVATPVPELRRTMEHVGLDPARHPGVTDRAVNRHPQSVPLSADLRTWLQQAYEDDVRDLLDLTDAIDVALWPSFEHLAR